MQDADQDMSDLSKISKIGDLVDEYGVKIGKVE
jgi:hypothetical protein